jgi:hypothetical protein
MTGRCHVPPKGWYCSREEYHDGPCAAHPVKNIWNRLNDLFKRDDVKQSSLNLRLTFSPNEIEYTKACEWINIHCCKGSTGDSYTWCFTPTGLGVACTVRCSCGAELNVTDYESW